MNGKGTFDFIAECERLEKLNAEMLEALKALIATMKLYATDGDVSGLLSVQDAQRVIAKAEGSK